MAIPELPTAIGCFHRKGARRMGPAPVVQHPHRPVTIETSAMDVATDHPVKAMAPSPGGAASWWNAVGLMSQSAKTLETPLEHQVLMI